MQPGRAQADRHPDAIAAQAPAAGACVLDFDLTVAAPGDSAQRDADASRVQGPGGGVCGARGLRHDPVGEQPLARDLPGVKIPAGVKRRRMQARDPRQGGGGQTIEVALPGR